MDFERKYEFVKSGIKQELDSFEHALCNVFKGGTELDNTLLEFVTAPSKRLRPVLGFLYLKAMGLEIDESIEKIFVAVELIHSATLIHDDVIDDSKKRRNQITLNAEFDSNLAVVAGDYLLSIALEKVLETESAEVIKFFTSAMKLTCIGEISQYFSRFTVPSLKNYVEKSKNKTALLFEVGILSSLALKSFSEEEKKSANVFAENFGIAFQVRDDLLNILNSDKLKDGKNDVESGVYTAPVIFALEENSSLMEGNDIFEKIKSTKAIEKTKALMDNYFTHAISNLEKIENNGYKKTLSELICLLKTSI